MSFKKSIVFEDRPVRVVYRAPPADYKGELQWSVQIRVSDELAWEGYCTMVDPTEEATEALVDAHAAEIQKGGTVWLRLVGLNRWTETHRGNLYIDAIKIVRRTLDVGLREAKDFVDAAESSAGVSSTHNRRAILNRAFAKHGMTSRFEIV